MDSFKADILSCLKDLKGSGKFISVHTAGFLFPGLKVDGVGELAYPVNEAQAKTLIQVAQKAPFGKGRETIVDTKVRSAWEIDADKLTFTGNRWTAFLKKILSNIKQDLGLEDYTIAAHLYKLLIYEKGDFFLPHKDSEKEKGMFGTLVIGLPSNHSGGELVVSFEGVEEVVSFVPGSDDYKITYAAFYADCDHEIKPVISGYRICLVYNLVQQKPGKKVQLTSIETHAERLAGILTKHQQRDDTKPHIVLLGHQYTPENFSKDRLKLNDRPKAEALLRAAQKAGCYAKMCLVTSYLSGMPADDGSYYGYDDDIDEDAEMAEVYDESIYIEHWLESEIPALSNVGFEENDLVASFAINDGEPIVKESTGYMGNYGPDLMYWYHYGAIMIWSPETNAQLLRQQNTSSILKWIGYFNKHLQQLSENEVSAVEFMLTTGLGHDRHDKDANYNAISGWVTGRKDVRFFLRLNGPIRQFYFVKIDAGHWLKLIDFFPSEITEEIFALVTQDLTLPVLEQLLAVLHALLAAGKFRHLVIPQIQKLPDYFSALSINPDEKQIPASGAALRDLFWIEKEMPLDKAWTNLMADIFTGYKERKYINAVLAPQLLALRERAELADKLLLWCRQYLQERVNNQPQPPADWSRQVPATTSDKKHWGLLRKFLESPDEKAFDYRKNQSERDELENAIRRVEIDLKTETIKKGSPYTLRITKTQAAYQREIKNWEEDRVLLNKIIQKIEEWTGRSAES
jgi:hypothetical protein